MFHHHEGSKILNPTKKVMKHTPFPWAEGFDHLPNHPRKGLRGLISEPNFFRLKTKKKEKTTTNVNPTSKKKIGRGVGRGFTAFWFEHLQQILKASQPSAKDLYKGLAESRESALLLQEIHGGPPTENNKSIVVTRFVPDFFLLVSFIGNSKVCENHVQL